MSEKLDLEALRSRLVELPEESPPPSVWLALQVAHAELHPRRRPQRWRYAAAAVVLVLLAPLLWMRQPAPYDPPIPEERAAALRSLDRELQLLYLDGASDAELAPLWRDREELLKEPAATPPVQRTIRI
jgi:hypothetical protein